MFVVQDHRLAPDFLPGDLLLPVTCRQQAPVLGEYVLAVDVEGGSRILRYVTPLGGPPAGGTAHLTWDGHRYCRLPAAGLRGRILSVRRGGRLFDLAVSSPGAWRLRLHTAGHRILARLQEWLPRSGRPWGSG